MKRIGAPRDLTQKRLMEVLSYDPNSGLFTWVITRNNFVKGGGTAGWPDRGYVNISVDGHNHRAHNLACLYMTGSFPVGEMDHINGNKSDNRWVNLRDVDRFMNMQNMRKATRKNALGVLGVRKNKNRFVADIRVNGKTKFLGSFKTIEEASAAYIAAKRRFHEGCTI